MSTIVRVPFSAGLNGRPIMVAGISSLNTTVHTSGSTSGTTDYVTVRAMNLDSEARLLTLEKDGAKLTEIPVPSSLGHVTLLDRTIVQSALAITAYAAVSSMIVLDGWVDRETV